MPRPLPLKVIAAAPAVESVADEPAPEAGTLFGANPTAPLLEAAGVSSGRPVEGVDCCWFGAAI